MRLVFDIEANGLYEQATKIWCICAKDIDTGETYEWTIDSGTDKCEWINDILFSADELIGHNIINYDLPLVEKLEGLSYDAKITDTLVMSRLGHPDRPKPPGYTGKGGPHSLEAWGYRVCKAKPDHETWDVFDSAMLRRCRADVEINHLVYNILRQEISGVDWEEALEIEHKIAEIITKQEHHGILFDKPKALEYVDFLEKKIEEIDSVLIPSLPYTLKTIGSNPTITNPFLKTGGYTKRTWSYIDVAYPTISQPESLVGGPFSRVEFLPFDLGSTEKVKTYLLENGWEPDEWNYSKTTGERTSPKLTGDFRGISGDLPRKVRERITWRHRKSQIEGWLERLRKDGRLSAGANPCGANTHRMKHHNVVNVPKANADKKTGKLIWDTEKQKDIFGTQMRSLFIAPPGFKIVGHDASGLELRMLAHYMNDPEYTDLILNGDIHEFNRQAAGLDTRDQAKTFIYALIYGAGDTKLGSIVGGTKEDGKLLKETFFERLPSLERLIRSVKRASGKGFVRSIDRRPVYLRRDESGRVKRSTALNCLLQSAGMICMKKSCILLWEDIAKTDITAYKILDMHDEGQAEVLEKDVELYADLAVNSIVKAGEYFNLNIPLAAEAKIGNNLAETH